jgi:hypothetical protein
MKVKKTNSNYGVGSTGGMAKKRRAACIVVFLAALSFVHANDFSEVIMEQGILTKQEMVDFLLIINPSLNEGLVDELIDTYIKEAAIEGVNHDIAFAQLCYHTAYLSFDKTFVKQSTYNYCGLASLYTPNTAHRFANREEGVRAHIQHLKGYATREPLKGPAADPRYRILIERNILGTAPTLKDLSNKWAGPDYAYKLRAVWRMVRLQNPSFQSVSQASLPF